MKKIYTIAIVIISLITYNCATDSVNDLVDVEPIINVTYNNDIAPIMETNCMPCHANPPQGAPISLTTFEEVMTATEVTGGNGVIDRISRQTGEAGAMPLGRSRLPQPTIDLIIQWRGEGFLEE